MGPPGDFFACPHQFTELLIPAGAGIATPPPSPSPSPTHTAQGHLLRFLAHSDVVGTSAEQGRPVLQEQLRTARACLPHADGVLMEPGVPQGSQAQAPAWVSAHRVRMRSTNQHRRAALLKAPGLPAPQCSRAAPKHRTLLPRTFAPAAPCVEGRPPHHRGKLPSVGCCPPPTPTPSCLSPYPIPAHSRTNTRCPVPGCLSLELGPRAPHSWLCPQHQPGIWQ